MYDEKGIAKIYLRAGDNNITFDKDGKVAERKVYVSKAGRFTFAIDFDNPDAIISGRNVLFRRMVILSGKCGDNAYYKLYNDGVLEISGTGDLYSYIKDHAPWYNYVVREVRIFDGITKIGVKDFYGLSMLTKVKLPNTLTSIDSAAFTGSGITEITIPKSLQSVATSYNYYGNYYYTPFQGCKSLKKMIFEDGIETIPNNMAKDCIDLEQVVLPASVKTIGDFAFQNSGLTSLTLPEGVETLGYQILYGNKGVKELTIPGSVVNFRYSTGTYYSGADRGCLEGSGLEKVIISNGITSIAPMVFCNCKSLRDVVIPNSVESIGFQAFDGCIALNSISIPESVTKIEYRAFEDTGLTELNLPSNITHVGSRVLNGNTGVKYLFIPKSFSDAGTGERLSSGQSMLYGSAVESVEFENGIETIPSNALKDAVSTTSVIIPGSVKTIGDFAFQNSGLTSLTLPEGVETLGYHFLKGNTGVKELTIPGTVTTMRITTATLVSGADRGTLEGSGLEKVVIGDGITSIAPMMFCYCRSLKDVIIPNSVETIDYQAFSGCNSLEQINLPDSITRIDFRAFENTGLTELNLPSNLTYLGSRVLNGSNGVKYLFLPKTFNNAGTGEKFGYGYTMLYGSSVETVEFENGIEAIPSNTFKDAASVTNAIIPISVTRINKNAFSNCSALSDVYYAGTEDSWNSITIESGNTIIDSVAIHCTDGKDIIPTGMNETDNSNEIMDSNDNQAGEMKPLEIVNVGDNHVRPAANHSITHTGAATASVVSTADNDDEDKQVSRDNLVPGTEALLVIIEGEVENATLNSDGLLYIAQATVDVEGTVSFVVDCSIESKVFSTFIIGQCTHSSSSWVTEIEPNGENEGLKVLVCNHCGEALDSESIESVPEREYLLGDVDGDESVTIIDATFIQRHLVGIPIPFEFNDVVADADEDNDVTIIDVTFIQRWLVGIPSNDRIEKPITLN